MKKKFALSFSLIISIIFSVFALFKVKAGIIDNVDKEYAASMISFNVVRGTYFLSNEPAYDRIEDYISVKVQNGTIENYMKGTFKGENHYIKEELLFENSKLIKISYSFDDTLFFSATTISSFEEDIILDKEYNIALELNDFNEVFEQKEVLSYLNDEFILDDDFYSDCVSYSFSFLYGFTYTYNTNYLDNDLHIVMNYFDKYTMDEIEEQIKIDDKIGSHYEIIENTYNYYESGVGEYSFVIVAWDDAKNVSVQKVFVDVVDMVKPKITQIKPVEVEFDKELKKDDIIACFEVTDVDTNPKIILRAQDYFDNMHTVGEYNATLTVKDNDDNETVYPFIIKVKDSIPPILMYSRIIYADYKTCYEEDDLKALFSATDAYDGDVSESIQIYDKNDYKNNYMNLGEYTFTITAEDSTGNVVSADIVLVVRDYDAPTISIEQYVILTEKGKGISRDQILDLFRSQGYEIDGNSLASECFSLDSLDGEYDLSIDLGDGNFEYDIITTINKNDISFEIPKKQDVNNNLALILSLSIGGSLIIAILTMGVIVYKKRH